MKKRHLLIGSVGAGLLVVGGLAGFVVKAMADGIPSPNPLYYSGTMTEGGSLVTGTRAITVNVWSDGTTPGTPLCSTVASTAAVTNGRFRIALASACKTAINANNNAYVEVIDGATSLGRAPIGTVPYAVEADHAVNATNATNATGALAAQLSQLQMQSHGASAFRARLTVNPPPMIPNNMPTAVVFDQVDFDLITNEYSSVTGAFTPGEPGVYAINCIVEYANSATDTDWYIYIENNGGEIAAQAINGPGGSVSPTVSVIAQLAAGDSVTCLTFQNSGAPQPLFIGAFRNSFSAARLY